MKNFSKIYTKLIIFCVKNRLGKTKNGARIIFRILAFLGKFIVYSNTYYKEARGHFVPQFILKKFRITDDQSKLGFVHSYKKSNKQFDRVKVRDCAQKPDFYIFRDKQGNNSDFTEQRVYRFLEKACSLIFDKYVHTANEAVQFTYLEKSIIITFLVHQLCRTPRFYKNLERYIAYLIANRGFSINKLFIDSKNINSEAVEKYIFKNYFNITAEMMREFRNDVRVFGKSANIFIQSIGSRVANALAESLSQKEINILDVKKQNLGLFVISDNPVVLLDIGSGVLEFPAWWRMLEENIFVFLPISPDKSIFLTNGIRRGGNFEDQESSLLELCNFGQFLNSELEVYSKSKSFLIECSSKYKI